MDRQIEDRIVALAASQYGVITRAQLRATGLLPGAVDRRIRAGRLRRLHTGVYLMGPVRPARATEMAAVLACGPEAVVSHVSAGRLWSMVRSEGGDEPVHVGVSGGGRRSRAGIVVHRVALLEPDERSVVDRIPVTAPGRTIVDLAGMVGSRELESAVARAEREGLIRRAELERLPTRYAGRPGIVALRTLLSLPGGPALTRSEAETRALGMIRRARLPPPEVNVVVGPYELDFLWREAGVAAEIDGFAHHGSRPRFESDRRRDSYLLARGIKVVRLTWRRLVRDELAAAVELGRAITRGER